MCTHRAVNSSNVSSACASLQRTALWLKARVALHAIGVARLWFDRELWQLVWGRRASNWVRRRGVDGGLGVMKVAELEVLGHSTKLGLSRVEDGLCETDDTNQQESTQGKQN
jgi:hypothetical protein